MELVKVRYKLFAVLGLPDYLCVNWIDTATQVGLLSWDTRCIYQTPLQVWIDSCINTFHFYYHDVSQWGILNIDLTVSFIRFPLQDRNVLWTSIRTHFWKLLIKRAWQNFIHSLLFTRTPFPFNLSDSWRHPDTTHLVLPRFNGTWILRYSPHYTARL